MLCMNSPEYVLALKSHICILFLHNSKRDIASANFVMHEMHCRRHISLCEHCQEPIPRSELEQHFNDVHAKIPCERCKLEVSKDSMEGHMVSK